MPQGCVLSPLLFIPITNYLKSISNSIKILKNEDDTTIIRLVTRDNEDVFRLEVMKTVNWCKENGLILNVKKTTEVVIDIRTKQAIKSSIANQSQQWSPSCFSAHTSAITSNGTSTPILKQRKPNRDSVKTALKNYSQTKSTDSILHSHNPKHPLTVNHCMVQKHIKTYNKVNW